MHRKFAAIVVALAFVPVFAGCEAVQEVLEGMDKPSAKVTGVNFGSLSMDRANLVFDVAIANPYSVPLPLANLDYGLSSGGASFVSGAAKIEGSVPAHGSKTIQVPVDLVFADIVRAVSGVRPGKVVPYTADLKLGVDAPGIGPLSLPMRKSGEVPVPAVPRVAIKNIAFDSLGLGGASGTIELEVENTNEFAADLRKMGYSLSLSGTPIVSTSVSKAASFKPGKAEVVSIPISFNPSNLGLAVLNVLRGEGASYSIKGDLDVGTRFGALSMPFDKSGSTSFSRK